jgi:peptidoglycan-associated lipoprotein
MVLQGNSISLRKMLNNLRLVGYNYKLVIIFFNNKGEANMRLFTVKYQIFLVAAFLLVAVSGCGKKTPEVVTGDPDALGPAESLETAVSEDDHIMEGRTSGPMRPVYFDFDSALIQGDQVKRIEANGDFLKTSNGVSVRIEGNCDSRGTREYNLALGERRAMSAKKYLVNLGVDPSRLATVSFGEEKLLLFGHDELSWAQNRRDDFVIVK